MTYVQKTGEGVIGLLAGLGLFPFGVFRFEPFLKSFHEASFFADSGISKKL